MQVVTSWQQLEAPGILRNAVPVEALSDRGAALERRHDQAITAASADEALG